VGDIIEIPQSERAHARFALRKHFGTGRWFTPDLKPWLTRWLGTFDTRAAYVACELEEILSPRDQWLAGYVDAEAIARDWEDSCRVVIAEDRRGRVHVFAWQEVQLLNPAAKREGLSVEELTST
jgi:hypothetical protein